MNSLSISLALLPALMYGLWGLFAGFILLIFLWLLRIEPYVRRRTRTSTFFLYPWAPWKDYLDGLHVSKRHRRGTPSFFGWFFWGSLLEVGGCLVWLMVWFST
ncbi:MAG: hypothetical protein P8L18_08935 [Verrucomicrobiota bacterium]|jgi:hypothetical protein|nr:hypothetical protein [Verrucomicrobiota bacterium]